jgi:acyl carrier protein
MLMDTKSEALAIIDFLRAKVLRNPAVQLREDTPLVSSGLVDSLALVQVLLQLEKVTNRKIPRSRVSPSDLDSVAKMLQTAEKFGKPR